MGCVLARCYIQHRGKSSWTSSDEPEFARSVRIELGLYQPMRIKALTKAATSACTKAPSDSRPKSAKASLLARRRAAQADPTL
jgi:hypothetical protein